MPYPIDFEEVPKKMKELLEKGLPQSELINPCFWCPFSPPDCPYSTCHYTETRQTLQDLWVEGEVSREEIEEALRRVGYPPAEGHDT